jgi:hypothetical protein
MIVFFAVFIIVAVIVCRRTNRTIEDNQSWYREHLANIQFRGKIIKATQIKRDGRYHDIACIQLAYCSVDSCYFYVPEVAFLKIKNGMAVMPITTGDSNGNIDSVEVNIGNSGEERLYKEGQLKETYNISIPTAGLMEEDLKFCDDGDTLIGSLVRAAPIGVMAVQAVAPPLLDRVLATYAIVKQFNRQFLDKPDGMLEDSTAKYNSTLARLVADSGFAGLKDAEIQKIESSTGINILLSQDKRLKVAGWRWDNPSPTASYCSTVLLADGKEAKIIALNGGGDKDFGKDISYDTLIQFSSVGRTYYLLTGSNSCGGHCRSRLASIYTISDGKIIKCQGCFSDGKQHLDEIEYAYEDTPELSGDLSIHFYNGKLTVPLFNDRQTRVTGRKTYQISGGARSQ